MNTRTDGMSCMHLFPNILAILIYLSKMFYKLILIQLIDVICIITFYITNQNLMLLNQNIQLFVYQYWMSLSTKFMTANYP